MLDCLHNQGNLDHTSEGLKRKLKQVIKLGEILACFEKWGEKMPLLLRGADSIESRITVMMLMGIA